MLLNPSLIVKVLSPSTESYDVGKKFGHYKGIPSLKGYVLISQDRKSVETRVRLDQGWMMKEFDESRGAARIESVAGGFEMPFDQIYSGVDFTAEPSE